MKTQFIFILLAVLSFTFVACDDEDPKPENPEELITTLQLIFTPTIGGPAIVQEFKDLDGDGGDDPIITTSPLADSTTYRLSLILLNESIDPIGDITEEIDEEAEDHQFFFIIEDLDMVISYDDEDADGNPVGLFNNSSTLASTGTLEVILRHEPDKDGSGVSDGDITNAGGDTDIQVVFPLIIE